MIREHFVSIYSRSYPSVVNGDLVATYAAMRYLYDPIPLRGDIATFSACSNWVQHNLDIFRSVTSKGELEREPKESLGRHMGTLAVVDEMSGNMHKLDTDKAVSFMPGSVDWLVDILSSTKIKVWHAKRGENKITDLDYFNGQLEPYSSTATLEILHQFLTCDDLVGRIKGNDGEFQLGLIMQAKDILYRVLMQSYLTALRSRAHKSEW